MPAAGTAEMQEQALERRDVRGDAVALDLLAVNEERVRRREIEQRGTYLGHIGMKCGLELQGLRSL